MSRKIGVLDLHQQRTASPMRYERKQIIHCLIARSLAEWVVRGTLARLVEPPKVQNGMVLRGTYKSFEQLQTVSFEDSPLPSAELPGLKFEEPLRRRREQPACALIQ